MMEIQMAQQLTDLSSQRARYLLGDRVLLGVTLLCGFTSVLLGLRFVETGLALGVGGVLMAVATGGYAMARGTAVSRYVLTFTVVSMVALQIQLGQGQTEFHFGVFVTLAFLLVYLDWRLIVFGTILFAVHHVVFDRLQAAGWGFYCIAQPDLPTLILHIVYVLLQSGVEIALAVNMNRAALEGDELGDMVSCVDQPSGINLHIAGLPVNSKSGVALQKTVARIEQVMVEVRGGADHVEVTCSEIAKANQNLSVRTEQTASHLQATASNLSSLSQAVNGTSQNAAVASQLSQDASAVAQKGEAVVSEVVNTMGGINEASRRIADIISIIDSIAFQTNILALNAAVEAARAGEEGRGFAVVASEVRSLAGRSAAAAKEIKTLINASVERVENGSQLVHQAGTTMSEVMNSIRKVTDIVAEIHLATAAQTREIAQVEAAVAEIDHATQQNASLVEEMAAATVSLSSKAQELVDAVSVFQTRGPSLSAQALLISH